MARFQWLCRHILSFARSFYQCQRTFEHEKKFMAVVRASSKLEDRRYQLLLNEGKLQSFCLDLESEESIASADCSSIEATSTAIQKALVAYLKLQAEEGNAEFDKVHKDVANMVTNMSAFGRPGCGL
jgi:hypothetical protein